MAGNANLEAMYRSWTNTLAANPQMSLEEMRELFEHWGDVTGEPGSIDYLESEADGIPALWAKPRNGRHDRVLLCFHGGGFVVGSMYSHRKLFGHLAKATGCDALILNYARAPEKIHPAPVNDGLTAYRWLLQLGFSHTEIAFAGDSAGGALAVSTILHAKNHMIPLPAAAALMSPFFDLEANGNSFNRNSKKDALVSRDIILSMTKMFVGEKGNPRDPLACPLYANLAGLPPIYVQVSEDESLFDCSVDFTRLARDAGVEVELDKFTQQQHVFQMLAGSSPEGDTGISRMSNWLRAKLSIA